LRSIFQRKDPRPRKRMRARRASMHLYFRVEAEGEIPSLIEPSSGYEGWWIVRQRSLKKNTFYIYNFRTISLKIFTQSTLSDSLCYRTDILVTIKMY
jgi:hypothetical protein